MQYFLQSLCSYSSFDDCDDFNEVNCCLRETIIDEMAATAFKHVQVLNGIELIWFTVSKKHAYT